MSVWIWWLTSPYLVLCPFQVFKKSACNNVIVLFRLQVRCIVPFLWGSVRWGPWMVIWVRWSPLGPPWTWGYASGWSACDLFSFLFYSTFSFSDCWSIDVFLHFCLHFCHHLLSLAHSSFSLVTLHCAALLRLDSVLQTSEVSESTRLMLVKLCHLVDKWNVIYILVHWCLHSVMDIMDASNWLNYMISTYNWFLPSPPAESPNLD